MNTLKVKTTIRCSVCGQILHRRKTIKVIATEKQAAIEEANEKIKHWQAKLRGQNCKFCQSIINSK